MSAVMQDSEPPEDAARRLFAKHIREGDTLILHTYRDASGEPLFWRVRIKHADGTKDVRPMRYTDANGYEAKEPPAPPAGKPLYGLDRLAAAPDAVVYIVEGEACADALHGLGLVAITSGSASSAEAADWTPLQGREVVLWPDNDAPGMKYTEAVAVKLRGLVTKVTKDSVTKVSKVSKITAAVVTALPEHGDVVDWLAAHPDATAADVQALPTITPTPATVATLATQCDPEPLRRPLPPPAAYPLDALGDVLGAAARAIHEVVQAPAAMCGTSILAAASLAAQAQADVTLDGRTKPLSLWAVTIGESGERKSAVDGWALGAHYRHEKDAQAEYRAELHDYENRYAAHEAARSKAKQGGKDTGRAAIQKALQDVGDAPEAPLSPILVLGEPTLEGTQRQLINGWPSVGLFSDDAGEFLGGFSMSRDNKTRTAAALSKLWDKGSFDRVRAKAEEVSGKYYGKRLALHFMVQPVIAEGVLSDPILCGQGFLPRCLLAWPDSTIGTRTYDNADLSENMALRRYWAKVHALLNIAYPLAEGSRNELDPRVMRLAADACPLWERLQNAVEKEQAEGRRYASVRAWASKTGEQVLRIAGVLTLIENPDAGVIGKRAVEQAAELALWHLNEAVRIVGTSSVPIEIRNAEKLRDWCHETGRDLLHSRAALRLGPNCIRAADTFNSAVDVLQATGWAEYIEGGAVVDGKRRRRVWRIARGEA